MCNLIFERMMLEVMHQPTEERWKETATEYSDRWKFIVLGALESKHVNIQASQKSGSQFRKYKKIFLVV
jgi:hypothetical protein